jgi:GNAT superfamily N-acetyltransferase
LICDLAAYEKLSHEVVATQDLVRDALFGARPYAEAIVATVEGRTIGFALFFHNFSTFLAKPGIYLEDLFVMPEYRGKGVGKQLFREIAKIAVDRGCGRFEWSVLDWNAPSIAFYEKMGAKAQSEWTVMRLSGDELHKLAGG